MAPLSSHQGISMSKRSINWEAITAVGQVISGAAVAATLFYLTIQVRHAETAASDANRLARANGVVNFWLSSAHDPDFRRNNMVVGGDNPLMEEIATRLGITEEEATQLESVAQHWFWLHWGQWSTTMEERDLDELKAMIQLY